MTISTRQQSPSGSPRVRLAELSREILWSINWRIFVKKVHQRVNYRNHSLAMKSEITCLHLGREAVASKAVRRLHSPPRKTHPQILHWRNKRCMLSAEFSSIAKKIGPWHPASHLNGFALLQRNIDVVPGGSCFLTPKMGTLKKLPWAWDVANCGQYLAMP